MRQIDSGLKALLGDTSLTGLKHKLLLYRRVWDTDTKVYKIESEPIDISNLINTSGTNITVTQQLDTDTANVWKTGNLTLAIHNKQNQFWQDKKDGLFPSPYIIYGSKLEYYVGSPKIDQYVKCFTGYLTELPTYRQDSGLVEIRALNRLDWLKTISAENVSTTVTGEKLTLQETRKYVTANAAVGRIQRVLKGTSLSSAIELTEKTDYTVSQLNEYDKGALIELKSDVLPSESIWCDYLYWYKGIMIDDLVSMLLSAADIESGQRVVEPVVFQNNARVVDNTILSNAWAWLYQTTGNTLTAWSAGNTYSNNYFYWSDQNNTARARWGCNLKYGVVRFRVSQNRNTKATSNLVGVLFGVGFPTDGLVITFGGTGGGGTNRNLAVNFKNQGQISLGTYADSDTFYIAFDSTNIKLYKNTTVIWSLNTPNFHADNFIFSTNYGYMIAEMMNLAAKNSTNPFDTNLWYDYQTCFLTYENTDPSFAGLDRISATVATAGVPNPAVQLRYGNSSANWGNWVGYNWGVPLQLNYNSLQLLIAKGSAIGN